MEETRRTIIGIRLEKCKEDLQAAQELLRLGFLRAAVNRAYYAMFYAVLALLSVVKKETTKHSGAIALFDRDFVKPGIFKKDFSRWLHDAFDLRQRSDYSAEYLVSIDEAEKTLKNAESFVEEIKKNLSEKMKLSGS